MRVQMRRPMSCLVLAVGAALAIVCGLSTTSRAASAPAVRPAASCSTAYRAADWPVFGRTTARSDVAPTGLTLAQLAHLRWTQIALPGTVDSSPILMTGIVVFGRSRNVIVVTTSYGISLGIDAGTGQILWRYTPPGYQHWAGTYQITETSPAADPDRHYVYVASPDGLIHKLALATGREVRFEGWPARVTLAPSVEKIEALLTISGCTVVATTSGYFDVPPYQGHLVTLNRATGRIVHVFNALCSNRTVLIQPATCRLDGSANWGSAIFGRGSPVIDPATGDLLIATGNGDWNGRTDWGDSVLALSPDGGKLLQNYTPTTQAALSTDDLDLGSSSPAILPTIKGWHLAVQGGKDHVLRLLNLTRLNGHGGARVRTGGELERIALPDQLFAAPAVIRDPPGALVLAGTQSALSVYQVTVAGPPRIRLLWQRSPGASSVVVAGGLIYAYDPLGSGLHVYRLNGTAIQTLPAGGGHWSSPIVAAGVIVLPEGSANARSTSGVLNLCR